MPCECACIRTRTHKEFNLRTIIGAQRRTGKSYCYNAQIINHPDILLALSLYIPLKWCLAQIVRGQTLNRPGLKCRSQTPSPLQLKLHRTRQLTLDVLSEQTLHQHWAGLTSREIVSHSGNAEAFLYLSHVVVSQSSKRVITNEEKKHLLISPCTLNQTSLANSSALNSFEVAYWSWRNILIPTLVLLKVILVALKQWGKQISIFQKILTVKRLLMGI